jgi:hypothetical protein
MAGATGSPRHAATFPEPPERDRLTTQLADPRRVLTEATARAADTGPAISAANRCGTWSIPPTTPLDRFWRAIEAALLEPAPPRRVRDHSLYPMTRAVRPGVRVRMLFVVIEGERSATICGRRQGRSSSPTRYSTRHRSLADLKCARPEAHAHAGPMLRCQCIRTRARDPSAGIGTRGERRARSCARCGPGIPRGTHGSPARPGT